MSSTKSTARMASTVPERDLEALHPACFGWALGCCGWNREEAEDVLQTVYLKVLDGRARFDGHSSLKTWLFAVIWRTAAERRRRQWLFDLISARLLRLPSAPPAPDPGSIADASETGEQLRAALQKLSARQRELLHLVFYQDVTIEEAATVLGISVGSARTHYHRGKARLRRLLPTRPA